MCVFRTQNASDSTAALGEKWAECKNEIVQTPSTHLEEEGKKKEKEEEKTKKV
jgi:hypothetical protein